LVLHNPKAMFSESRNVVRQNDLKFILDSISYYQLENGEIKQKVTIPSCSNAATIGKNKNNVDLQSLLTSDYLSYMPVDPEHGDEFNTGYLICIMSTGRIKLSAPFAENDRVIDLIR
jgi:hypothetical protein